jgi:stage II sporulation protein D
MAEEIPRIRVKIGDDAPSVRVAVGGPWRLVGADGDLAKGETLAWTPVRAAGQGVAVGSLATADGPVELHAADADPVYVDLPGRKKRGYRGYLRLEAATGGRVRVVNVVSMEAYLAGVLADEMYDSWHLEAFKAQAVAARTYALRRRNARQRYAFDVYDTPMSQVYGGVGAETKTAWEAVRTTWGVVATCEGGGRRVLLPTFYHSTCGGDTVPSGTVFGGSTPPPLRGGTGCTYCRNSHRYRWKNEVVLTKAEIGEAVRRSTSPALSGLGVIDRVEVAERTGDGGRAQRIRLVDTAGRSVLMRASDWRIRVGASKVPSTWFRIEDRGDAIALTDGRGFGHGVGLCQFGAQFLATHGQTGEQILRYYYPGVDLVRAY